MLVEGGEIMNIDDLIKIFELLRLYVALEHDIGIPDKQIIKDFPCTLQFLLDYVRRSKHL